MAPRRSLTAFLVGAAALSAAHAATITYDDTDAAWNYIGNWGVISAAAPCTACNTQPDPKKTHGGTWHDLSQGGSAQLSFVGSSLVVYAVCPKGIYRSNFTFLLDNEPAGTFLAPEGGCNDYVYNQAIFHKSGLSVSSHIFQVNNFIAPGEQFSSSDLVIDYAVVNPVGATSATATLTPSKTTSTESVTRSTAINPPSTTSTAGRNTTVDDADPAWTYTGPWGAISAAQPCAACVTQPDAKKAHATTWHDLSQAGSAQLLFTGNALSLYAICPGPLEGGGAFSSHFSFTLDGKANGTFTGPADGCKAYQYNQLVYNVVGLEQGTHNFTISNVVAAQGAGNPSDLILDYAIIGGGSALSGTGSSSSSSSNSDSSSEPTPTPDSPEENGDNGCGSLAHANSFVVALLAVAAAALAL
ncbi:hypothetical protein EXIGLDRAFT_776422 [Exidia glandulosa HHB12029]|uniref:Uncharacterized protein n=1 Tax=Exidia glandulosa HHB12029 TaxID=1314781 RepID=A0A165DHH0_EXIGL|nr:hypothetical protein EXIGLDRAFT_776422 [Exidia glandulosa HHB12029]